MYTEHTIKSVPGHLDYANGDIMVVWNKYLLLTEKFWLWLIIKQYLMHVAAVFYANFRQTKPPVPWIYIQISRTRVLQDMWTKYLLSECFTERKICSLLADLFREPRFVSQVLAGVVTVFLCDHNLNKSFLTTNMCLFLHCPCSLNKEIN